MRKTLRRPIENLRDGLHAALGSAKARNAPGALRAQLVQAVALLDGVLAAASETAGDMALARQLDGWAHQAVARGRVAIGMWQDWLENRWDARV